MNEKRKIQVGDRVEHIYQPFLDFRTVLEVGDDWLILDFFGNPSDKFPLSNYRTVVPL